MRISYKSPDNNSYIPSQNELTKDRLSSCVIQFSAIISMC